ncbi:MAG: SsrA-binding protein SmpB [Bacteriovoracaceae bacterium]|jgi:SsrA-binding protein|nr:SsrA-binding protein SmpB [Bacteriovoracaceae bacterium]
MGGIKIIAKNKRASYDYALQDQYEAGIVLQGTEVKTLRGAKCSMNEAYCTIDKNNEAWIHNMTIPHYEFGTYANHNETRKRKLLLHMEEITQIQKALATKGQTLIPTKIYFKGSYIKVEIYLGKGKKLHDKREASAKKDIERKLRQGKYD